MKYPSETEQSFKDDIEIDAKSGNFMTQTTTLKKKLQWLIWTYNSVICLCSEGVMDVMLPPSKIVKKKTTTVALSKYRNDFPIAMLTAMQSDLSLKIISWLTLSHSIQSTYVSFSWSFDFALHWSMLHFRHRHELSFYHKLLIKLTYTASF